MGYIEPYEGSMYLSFEEANILFENLLTPNHRDMIVRLDNLLTYTSDPYLKRALESLLEKIRNLTQDEFTVLFKDKEEHYILFPPYYKFPYEDQ